MSDRLASATSPYLRGGAGQPVDWHPWGEEAFARARAEGKPVLLNIGASWCRGCHEMDDECYRDPQAAAAIAERFIAVRVDRDERPDVDARYQAALEQLTGLGGWPLTAFLTPDGGMYFGGNSFPLHPRGGSPGFLQILTWASELYRSAPEKRAEEARRLRETIAAQSRVRPGTAAVSRDEAIRAVLRGCLDEEDRRHGGFGDAPKFPCTGALDLCLRRAEELPARDAALRALRAMTAGKIRDRAGGGFYRYAVDERWEVPHFEKLLSTNAEMLSLLTRAVALSPEPELREAQEGTARFLLETLADREQGGFRASVGADGSLDPRVIPAWNGLAAVALPATPAAERALERVLAIEARAPGAPALAGDALGVAEGCLAVFEAKGDPRWLAACETLLRSSVRDFFDAKSGAFRDRAESAGAIAGEAWPRHPLEENALALRTLARFLARKDDLDLRRATDALAASMARTLPLFAPLQAACAAAALSELDRSGAAC